MSAFDKLLNNKMIKGVFMNQFKGIIKEHNLKAIVIHVMPDGSFEPELCKEDIKVLTVTEYNKLINSITSQL